MRSSKLILTVLALTVFATATYAQSQKRTHKKDISELKEELDLTDEQTLKIIEARTATRAKMNVLKAEEKLAKEERRAAFREIRKEQRTVIDGVLTEEQKAKQLELRKKEREVHKRKRIDQKGQRGDRKQNRAEILQLRSEFDQQISPEDKIEIERLKVVLKKERKDGERPSKADREAFRESHKADFESLKALNEKYELQISNFMQERGKSPRGDKQDKMRRGNQSSKFLLMPIKKKE